MTRPLEILLVVAIRELLALKKPDTLILDTPTPDTLILDQRTLGILVLDQASLDKRALDTLALDHPSLDTRAPNIPALDKSIIDRQILDIPALGQATLNAPAVDPQPTTMRLRDHLVAQSLPGISWYMEIAHPMPPQPVGARPIVVRLDQVDVTLTLGVGALFWARRIAIVAAGTWSVADDRRHCGKMLAEGGVVGRTGSEFAYEACLCDS